jgi:hypothetical protein
VRASLELHLCSVRSFPFDFHQTAPREAVLVYGLRLSMLLSRRTPTSGFSAMPGATPNSCSRSLRPRADTEPRRTSGSARCARVGALRDAAVESDAVKEDVNGPGEDPAWAGATPSVDRTAANAS